MRHVALAPKQPDQAERKQPAVGAFQRLIDVRHGDRAGDGAAVDLGAHRAARIENRFQLGRDPAELGGRRGDEAPVLLPGLAVNRAQPLDFARELRQAQRPRDDPFARAQALRKPGDDRRRLARDVVDPGEQVLRLAIAGGLEERRILPRVVRHHQHRVAVEPVDQQARAFVERWIDRPAQRRPAAALRPCLHRFHQRLCGGGVVGFEKPEHRDVVAVALVVKTIVDRGDAAGDAMAAPREQQLDVGVGEERILSGRQPLVFGDPQRRHPVRIRRVAIVGVIDEPAELAPALHAPNVNHLALLNTLASRRAIVRVGVVRLLRRPDRDRLAAAAAVGAPRADHRDRPAVVHRGRRGCATGAAARPRLDCRRSSSWPGIFCRAGSSSARRRRSRAG